jgi:hypothetical protein
MKENLNKLSPYTKNTTEKIERILPKNLEV